MESEVHRVFGAAAGSWSAESLVHNPRNAVTAGVWRVAAGSETAILKLLTAAKKNEAGSWAASDDPAHWNYWRRIGAGNRRTFAGDRRRSLV